MIKHSTNHPQPFVLITAGGTGGHVMPAYTLYQALIQQGQFVHFVIDSRTQSFIAADALPDITVMPLPRYQGGAWQKIKFLTALFTSIYRCWRLIQQYKITVVVGFGGYVTVPALIAAIMARCTIILHEQNAVLGRVNRLFARFATKIALSTPSVHNCPKPSLKKCVITGLPVRPAIEKLRHILQPTYTLHSDQFHILIIGGSQAAAFFSDIMPQALALLPDSYRHKLVIYQQCRAEDLEDLQTRYEQLALQAKLQTFFVDIATELQQADLIFARAGASTIAEISLTGKAAFLVPYPHALDDHQTINAQFAMRSGGGWWQPQTELTPDFLNHFLQYIMNNPQVLTIVGETLRHSGYPQAARHLMKLVKNNQPT